MARPVGYVVGLLAAGQAACVALAEVLPNTPRPWDENAAIEVLASALLTGLCGAGIWAYGRSAPDRTLRRREATLVVAAIWLVCGVFGALPFVIDAGISPVDAFFEAVSGFTTTGATIVTDIEHTLSYPLMLWRSLMQWLGGMGIVVLFVAVFPNLGVGAKHLFRSEAPGPPGESLQPRIAETSFVLWRLYLLFTVVEAVILYLLGMTAYEALCHAMTTMSTGGFSTRDASVAAFDSAAIETVIAVFMLLAGVNFSLYYTALATGSPTVFLRSTEFKVYLGIALGSTALLTLTTLGVHDDNLWTSLRYSFFTVATFLTSTGYGTDDYMAYPGAGLLLVFFLMFVGGSAGSTAGGLKASRAAVLTKQAWAQIRQSLRPNLVQVVRMDGRAVPTRIVEEAGAFLTIFVATLLVCTLVVAYTDGVPAETAFGATLSCVSNMGPGPYYLEGDNFAGYSDAAKLVFSVAMVLGRLEFFTLLALLLPDFWKR